MARSFTIASMDDDVVKDLARSFQSGHINFLLGAGASFPAIPLAGDIEAQLDILLASGKHADARSLLLDFLRSVQQPTNTALLNSHAVEVATAIERYRLLLSSIERLLTQRRTTVLPRQATIFTTNYDVLIDLASVNGVGATVTNGFERSLVPDVPAEYSSRRFFLTTYDSGNMYDYKVELPMINVVKLHGCLSWKRDKDRIVQRPAHRDLMTGASSGAKAQAFIDSFAVILPKAEKFHTTVLDRTYYELLRFYANSLDKENALLVAFGFSFRDEHIMHITQRALKNPTLRLIALAFDMVSAASLETLFAGFNNVVVLSVPSPGTIDFDQFILLLNSALPKA